MTAPHANVIEPIEAAHGLAADLPAEPWREPLLRQLAWVLDQLGVVPPPKEGAIQWALEAAMQTAAVLAADGRVGHELLDKLGAAYNAVLDRPSVDRALIAEARPQPSSPVRRAARGAPAITLAASSPSTAPASPSGPPAAAPDETAEPESSPPRKEPRPALPEEMAADEPPIRLRDEGGEPVPVERFYAQLVHQCADAVAAAARARSESALARKSIEEARLLVQVDAIAAARGDSLKALSTYWDESLSSRNRYRTWAVVFTLACFDVADSLDTIRAGLDRMPADAIGHVIPAAEALAVAPHPEIPVLCRTLMTSPNPIARAVGIEALSLRRAIGVDDVRRSLIDVNVPVLAAATRAAARFDRTEAAPLLPILQKWTSFPDAAVAWPAARGLLLWGDPTPYDEVRAGGRLARTLGPASVEIFVLRGSAEDVGRIQAILAKRRLTGDHLDALARFGHPGVWSFLIRQLEQEDVADAAADALTTLFGPRVEPDDLANASAWTSAIRAMKLDPATRYRRGEPWTPAMVTAECASGELSRWAVQRRIDELRVRLDLPPDVDLWRWDAEARSALAGFLDDAARRDAHVAPGAW